MVQKFGIIFFKVQASFKQKDSGPIEGQERLFKNDDFILCKNFKILAFIVSELRRQKRPLKSDKMGYNSRTLKLKIFSSCLQNINK